MNCQKKPIWVCVQNLLQNNWSKRLLKCNLWISHQQQHYFTSRTKQAEAKRLMAALDMSKGSTSHQGTALEVLMGQTNHMLNHNLFVSQLFFIFYWAIYDSVDPLVYRNLSIYIKLCWVAWTMGQTNRRPRVWCSKYYFLILFIDLGHSKLFILIL